MDEKKQAELQEQLSILNVRLEGSFHDAVDLNSDIILATRKMAHNLLTIRNGHITQAERLLEMVRDLAASAGITAEITADVVAAEWGIEIAANYPQDAGEFDSDLELDDEDEEDDE